jgi:hypothetical protein
MEGLLIVGKNSPESSALQATTVLNEQDDNQDRDWNENQVSHAVKLRPNSNLRTLVHLLNFAAC